MTPKTYLITGGTAGIGYATAKSLSKQGHSVVITGRNAEKIEKTVREIHGDVIGILCDSAKHEDTTGLGDAPELQGMKLDGVVLNAGVYFPNQFGETTLDQFSQTFDVNFRAPFFSLQSLLPRLNDQCSVVMVSSLVVNKAFADSSLYSASKMALEGFVSTLNVDLAARDIRINSVRPGVTATEIQGKAGMTKETLSELREAMTATALGRILEASDIVPSIEFLLSDASLGMRSAAIDIDAGFGL
ncbi:SDR family oxidoreductase [Vibrio sp. 10N.261.55.A7]|uniref:SDR family NAD(P)-dependent oxidoreductase n=1 Tax=Vibrio sp. 10N.261.55.A7 TaxID=1880851 RepID=UPI000C853E3E|nr:SDR family oxidoreductase [Vibrio sp. 10N.261.55.A7]PMJ91388.1 short-chain dehydrogenase [Vibrio sp. 10N.261.55.A7]